MFHIEDNEVRNLLMDGHFGLEKESLRVKRDGYFSHEKHPFQGNKHIVRDFCENQTEVNTGVHDSPEEAVDELTELTNEIQLKLASMPEPEILWPFSNPPYIRNEEDIPIAQFYGEEASSTAYREYLSDYYGRYRMTFSGIHYNFSFSEELLQADFDLSEYADFRTYKDQVYITLAERCAAYGWILTALTAASPVLDGSYVEKGAEGRTDFNGMATSRCSELGYWNFFTPIFEYTDVKGYADSIQQYVEDGMITAPRELYYPIRLKPRGVNTLDRLRAYGVDHIELRMIDLNPLRPEGVDIRDLKFAHLFLIWLASTERQPFERRDQVQAVQNFKNAAHYDLKTVKITAPSREVYTVADAGLKVLGFMKDFYREFPQEVQEILLFEEEKFLDPDKRYAWIIRKEYADHYVKKGIRLALERQLEALKGSI